MLLETDRLILRPLTLVDAETAYCGWTGDAEVARFVSWLPHHSIDDTIKWLEDIEWKQDGAGNIIPSDNYIWGFVLKETGELFGSGGLIWEEGCRLYQVGYNIRKTHWNRGYTTEAMRAVLSFAAKNLGIKRVAGGHAKENLASAKVIEKLGFVYDRDDITPHIDGIQVFDSREYYLNLETEKLSMTSEKVLDLYDRFKENGITIWICGGWCIDALLEKQTRMHEDLDIAVHRKDNVRLRQLLEEGGYKEEKRDDSSEFMYVMQNAAGESVDVHAFEYDKKGKNTYGIEFPFGSLTGKGKICGQEVKCVSPEWMFKFITSYEPREKDLTDIHALSEKFGFELSEG